MAPDYQSVRVVLGVVLTIAWVGANGCHKSTNGHAAPKAEPAPVSKPAEVKEPAAPPAAETKESPPSEPLGQISLPDELPAQWLVVEKAREGRGGAWARGSFDAERNRIRIATNAVAEFTVDIDQIPINWERLVVIGIDGINSELRKRDYSPIRFRRDNHGRWSVVEP